MSLRRTAMLLLVAVVVKAGWLVRKEASDGPDCRVHVDAAFCLLD